MAEVLTANLGRDDAPAWLASVVKRGSEAWREADWPNRKTEAWKYTSLRALERGEYSGVGESPVDADGLEQYIDIKGMDACRLVFVNGQFDAGLSTQELPPGISLVTFSQANETEAEAIVSHLGSIVDREAHIFAALNDGSLRDGVFLHVQEGVQLETPIQVVWLSRRQPAAFTVSQRLLVVLDAASQATVVEQFVSDASEQNVFTNGVSEFSVGEAAHLRHYRLHLEQEQAAHIGGMHVNLAADAVLDSFQLALGGILKRIDVVVNHRGKGAECLLNGVYLPRHDQQVDYHTCIEHRVPGCTTNEVFRGIISDRARAVFNGRIHIHADAQKTKAELSNKNLLTSDKAEVDTKPELEIYADDVQCAHGATVAQLGEEAVFYLCSRGIPRQDAEVMLSFGFINELINNIRDDAVASYLRPMLEDMFARHDLLPEASQ